MEEINGKQIAVVVGWWGFVQCQVEEVPEENQQQYFKSADINYQRKRRRETKT